MKTRYSLHFPQECIELPIVYELCNSYGIKVNIFNADVSPGREGSMIVDFENSKDEINNALKYLERIGIAYSSLQKYIEIDEEACIHCGACTAVCFSACLSMSQDCSERTIDREKCILCGLCEKACPLGIIKINNTGF